MTLSHYLGALAALLFIPLLGAYSGLRIKSAADFATGNKKAGAGIVLGSIFGSLVGGASTLGTAQLAYSWGFSAWWLTLGAAAGCLVLGGLYAKPLYDSGVGTLPQLFYREYGRQAAAAATLLASLGSFLSIVSQVLAGVALITSVAGIAAGPATLLAVALMFVYVWFGGAWGVGLVGVAKTALLCFSVVVCGLAAFHWQGGWEAFPGVLPVERYFNLIARGFAVDVGVGFSIVLGVPTTQTYIQTLLAGRTLRLSRIGIFASASLIPLVGLAGILVGLHMRVQAPGINPAGALPLFILGYMPPFFGGLALATLLIAVVGTAAGSALGISSMFCNDLYKVYCNPAASDGLLILVSRMTLAVILAAAAAVTLGNLGSLILDWSFMSMGLRGAVAFGALTAAITVPGRIPASYALASMILGPVGVVLGKVIVGGNAESLFFGVACGLLVLFAGYVVRRAE